MGYAGADFDDEDELRRQHGYAPAIVGSSPLTAGVDANPYPAPAPVSSPAPAESSPYPAPKPASDASSALTDSLGALKEYQALGTQEPQRTSYKEKPLGTGRKIALGLASFAAGLKNPEAGYQAVRTGLDEPRNEQDRLYNQAHTDWQNKMNVSGNRVKLGEEIAKTQHDLNPPKDKEESWEIAKDYTGPNGEPLETEKNSGQMRIVGSQQPIDPKTAKRYEKPDNNEHEKQLSNWLAANKLPDTPANREKAEDALAKRAPQAHVSVEGAGGSWMPTYDDKGHVTGAWNPKTGQIQKAPANMQGTTAQGHTQEAKADAELEKKVAPYRAIVNVAEEAKQSKELFDKGNAPAGVDLALAFFKTMRGATQGSNIRFTQAENNLIMGARSLWGALEVKGNKIFANGQPLSAEQANEMMQVIEMHAQAAQRQMQQLQGGKPEAGGGQKVLTYNPATGKLE